MNLYSGCNCMPRGHCRLRVHVLDLGIQIIKHLSFVAETGGALVSYKSTLMKQPPFSFVCACVYSACTCTHPCAGALFCWEVRGQFQALFSVTILVDRQGLPWNLECVISAWLAGQRARIRLSLILSTEYYVLCVTWVPRG